MRMDELKTIHLAQPFRPFVLHMGDGRSLTVKHPDFLARSPNGRTAIVFGDGDAFEVVDIMLVTGIEVPNGSGGVRRRGRG